MMANAARQLGMSHAPPRAPLIVVVGATGTGKSHVSIIQGITHRLLLTATVIARCGLGETVPWRDHQW